MEDYEKGIVLGEGTFGSVVRAVHKKTGEVFAIKKIRLGNVKEGVNMTALREVKLLKELQNARIVRLVDVFAHKQNLALVFEFMESDLEMVIKNRATVMSSADVKAYLRMALEALAFCHERWVVHRDVKPNNFLIAASGEMKLADFGLARIYGSPDRKYTNQVFARWYRPPELLFGSTLYGPGIDIWAAGCVFAELLLRRPWMPGGSDIEQLSLIFQSLGTPTPEAWPGAQALPHYVEFQYTPAPSLKSIFPKVFPNKAGEDALDLLSRMMAFDPNRRISAAEALQHRYFKAAPEATHPSRLPKPPVRAHNPLHHQPVGGSALQAAPQEALADLEQPSSTSHKRADEEGERQRGAEMGTGLVENRNGMAPDKLRPQADREELRYLRKRKLDMDEALNTA